MKKDAIFSECGTYRYYLNREWDHRKRGVLFFMLNGSTAGVDEDDPTIRKCIGFAERMDRGSIHVVNMFGFVATDPKEMLGHSTEELLGPMNRHYQTTLLRRALDVNWDVICAWGAKPNSILRSQPGMIRKVIRATNISFRGPGLIKPMCFGKGKNGQPLHPLMLAYSTPLEPW